MSRRLSHLAAALVRAVVPAGLRPIRYLEDLARRRTSARVRSGPFAGMRYGRTSIGSAYIPKLLGTYERELSPLIENACGRRHSLLVDIGAAEGYYAVGFALRNPSARVVAFEADALGRVALEETAVLNGVAAQIDCAGKCEVADLEGVLESASNPLVVCDVEGYEEILLDPLRVPSLRHATIVAEMHDFMVPGVSELMRSRFEPTHEIREVLQEPRDAAEFPWRTLVTALLPASYLNWAVSEWRPVRMSWLWMEPRRH